MMDIAYGSTDWQGRAGQGRLGNWARPFAFGALFGVDPGGEWGGIV